MNYEPVSKEKLKRLDEEYSKTISSLEFIHPTHDLFYRLLTELGLHDTAHEWDALISREEL